MTTETASTPLFEDDPILGSFVAYFPSYRLRLIIQAAVLYAIPVLALQVLFAEVDSLLIPMLYAAIALLVGWYVLHQWNREVTVYERGFTYRQGSQIGYFRYPDIIRIHQKAQRVSYFGLFRRDSITYTLNTEHAEVLKVNGIYKDVSKLGLLLERKITEARQPLVEVDLRQGRTVAFGEAALTKEGIHYQNTHLPWADYDHYAITGGALRLYNQADAEWAAIPLDALDNLMLLIYLLKAPPTDDLSTNPLQTPAESPAE